MTSKCASISASHAALSKKGERSVLLANPCKLQIIPHFNSAVLRFERSWAPSAFLRVGFIFILYIFFKTRFLFFSLDPKSSVASQGPRYKGAPSGGLLMLTDSFSDFWLPGLSLLPHTAPILAYTLTSIAPSWNGGTINNLEGDPIYFWGMLHSFSACVLCWWQPIMLAKKQMILFIKTKFWSYYWNDPSRSPYSQHRSPKSDKKFMSNLEFLPSIKKTIFLYGLD